MTKRTTLADALHQAGRFDEARDLFEEAEALQKKLQPTAPLLYSLQGFEYCDLLLALGQLENVGERAARALALSRAGKRIPVDLAFACLSSGRARLLLALRDHTGDLAPACAELDEAVTGLRQAGHQDHLPRGLLARAELHLATSDLHAAQRDLDEALLIATHGGMRLHETDAHLGFARLHLARGDHSAARSSFASARALVERTGYHRRDRDLAEIEAALTGAASLSHI